ncbi:cilia- and flagella-associated protein 53 [Embiotoca jacksoni]|uniref:cilia- and flagella-associated protein 53 n=1 Tax=Embiotoca jacksoni TaxID=100190 RepID=UPI003704C0F4
MLLSPRRTRVREVTGPTPHSVAVIAKSPPLRPPDHLILQRRKQDVAQDQILEFKKYQRACEVNASWLRSTERRFLRGDVARGVRAALNQHESDIEDRRCRLWELLEAEQVRLLQEMEEKKETTAEKQEKMKDKFKMLRGRREIERQRLVSDKLEQLFRDQCEELRRVQVKLREQQVCEERAAQVRSREEERWRQQQEEELFEELWEADRRAKEQRESLRAERQREETEEQLSYLRRQMDATEQQREEQKELKLEEARLMLQQRQVQQQQQQQQQQQKLQDQQIRRRQLDQDLRLKMKRLAQEQQDELQLDMRILQQALREETDVKQESAQKKVELQEDQRRYRQYLSEELQRQRKEEEETQQLVEEKLKETWTKRDQVNRLQREARHRLKVQVMEGRQLQVQQKQDANLQKQAELQKEREELERSVEEAKLQEEEQKKCLQRAADLHQADLRGQIKQQLQLRCEQRDQEHREQEQGLILQHIYNQKKDHILSRPVSDIAPPHPFRRGDGARCAPETPPPTQTTDTCQHTCSRCGKGVERHLRTRNTSADTSESDGLVQTQEVLIGPEDQKEVLIGPEDQKEVLIGPEDQEEVLIGPEDQKEVLIGPDQN